MKKKKRSQVSDMFEFWHSCKYNPTWKLKYPVCGHKLSFLDHIHKEIVDHSMICIKNMIDKSYVERRPAFVDNGKKPILPILEECGKPIMAVIDVDTRTVFEEYLKIPMPKEKIIIIDVELLKR